MTFKLLREYQIFSQIYNVKFKMYHNYKKLFQMEDELESRGLKVKAIIP
jgi:hypothetical protein